MRITDIRSRENMEENELQILYVDDEPDFLEIAQAYLQFHQMVVTTATSGHEALNILKHHHFDVIISDYQMHRMDGLTFLSEIKARGIDIPFILFTGRGREEVVISAIENGADYYVQKGSDTVAQFTELIHKIRFAVSQRVSKQERKELEEAFRLAFEGAHDAIFWADAGTGTLVNCNEAAEYLIGTSRENIIGKDHLMLYPPDWADYHTKKFAHAIKSNLFPEQEVPVITREGEEILVRISYSVTRIGDRKIIQGLFRNISENRRDQIAIAESQNRFNTLFDSIPVPTWEVDFSEVKNYFNSCREQGVGSIREFLSQHPEKIRYCISLIRVIHVNKATLQLFGVRTCNEAVLCTIALFTEESWPVFGRQLIALDEGVAMFEEISPVCDPQGRMTHLTIRATVDEIHRETLSQVFVSYMNTQ